MHIVPYIVHVSAFMWHYKCFVNGDTQKGSFYSTDDLEMTLVQVSLLGARDMFVRTRQEEFCYLKDYIKF